MSPTYRYIARDWQGNTRDGVQTAGSLKEALEHLRGQKLVVLNVREQAGAARASSGRQALFQRKVKARDFMIFCRQFGTMIASGMTALYALQVLSMQAEHPELKERVRQVAHALEKGSSLTDAFAMHPDFFPRIMVNMVAAGEAGGILEKVLERLASHFEKQHDLEEKIRSATTYPIIITIAMFLVMCVMVFFVLPRFASIFDSIGVPLPLITRMLLALIALVLRFWYIVLGTVFLLGLAFHFYIRTEEGRLNFDRFRLKLPVFGPIYRKAIVARFSRTLSTLLVSGVGILPALELVEKVIDNKVLGKSLERTREVIRQGQTMASPLRASGLFPPMLVEMVHVGEETGTLDEMLERTADFYEAEVAYVVERLSTVIEPVLILCIGVFVGLLIVSIITPLFEIYRTL